MNKKIIRNEINSKRYDFKQPDVKRGAEKVKTSKINLDDSDKTLQMSDRGDVIVKAKTPNTSNVMKAHNTKLRKVAPLFKTKEHDVDNVPTKDLGKGALDHGDNCKVNQAKGKNEDRQGKSRNNNELAVKTVSELKDGEKYVKVNDTLVTQSGDSIDLISSLIPKVKIERKFVEVALETKPLEPVRKTRVLAEKGAKKVDCSVEMSKLDTRKRIHDKYTVKFKKASPEECKSVDAAVNQPKSVREPPTPLKDKVEQLCNNSDKEKTSEPETRRKPIIKTVSSKNGPAYKSVAFVDQKPQKIVQICVPNEKPQEANDRNKVNQEATRAQVHRDKFTRTKGRQYLRKKQRKVFKTRYRTDFSPEGRFSKDSLITEVAKWAPSCINRHTKPYYEAWVNTTLAAISKSSKKDKMFLEKKSIIQSFQKALEEVPSWPELVNVDYTDEKYTGKIKVIHR